MTHPLHPIASVSLMAVVAVGAMWCWGDVGRQALLLVGGLAACAAWHLLRLLRGG